MQAGRADVLYGITIAVIAAALFTHTFSDVYEFNPLIESVSTVFFPRIILASIILCAIGLIVKGVRSLGDDDHLEQFNIARIVLVFMASSGTAAGIWFIGYFYAMHIGVFLTGWALGYPNKAILAMSAVVATILTWVALGYFASVIFPTEFRLN